MLRGKFEDSDNNDIAVKDIVNVPISLEDGSVIDSKFISFSGLSDQREHIAVKFGSSNPECPMVRLHSECLTGDVFGSQRCDCGPQLQESIKLLNACNGTLLYLRQEGRGIGLYNKIKAYQLQDEGYNTYEANRLLGFSNDERNYIVAAEMLKALGIKKINLLSNNPDKRRQLENAGISVHRMIKTGVFENNENREYLMTKVVFSKHTIEIKNKGVVK